MTILAGVRRAVELLTYDRGLTQAEATRARRELEALPGRDPDDPRVIVLTPLTVGWRAELRRLYQPTRPTVSLWRPTRGAALTAILRAAR